MEKQDSPDSPDSPDGAGVPGQPSEFQAMWEAMREGMWAVMVPLSAPVPPVLEEALGYEGGSRLVVFYWTQSGDELLWEDGRWTGSAHDTAWSAYTRHRLVAPFLAGQHFGGEGRAAEYYLLLDRQERTVWAGEMLPVMRLLTMQHPGRASRRDIQAQLSRGVRLVERESNSPPHPRQVEAWKQAQLRLEAEILHWLDQQEAQGSEQNSEVTP